MDTISNQPTLSFAPKRREGHRVGGTSSAFRCLDRRSPIYFIRVLSGHRGIGTRCSIEDTVVIEVPAEAHVTLRWIESGGQRDVDEVTTQALLILHAGSEGNRRRGETSLNWSR